MNTASCRVRGFTLLETVIVIALTTLVVSALGSLLVYFYQNHALILERTAATTQVRRGIGDAVRYLREAAYPDDGSYPIENAEPMTVTFYADMDDDTALERITYTLTEGTLFRTVIGEPAARTLATGVANGTTTTPVFRYFDAAGTELIDPVVKTDIASVVVTLDIEMNREPAFFTLSGRATLRNKKL